MSPSEARSLIQPQSWLKAASSDIVSETRFPHPTIVCNDNIDTRTGPWPELQAFAAQYALSDNQEHRRIAYQLFSRIPRLLLDQETEEVVGALQQGLSSDSDSLTQQAALEASVAFLTATDKAGRDRASRLLAPMLNVSLEQGHL